MEPEKGSTTSKRIEIGVFAHGMILRDPWQDNLAPWIVHREKLRAEGIDVHLYIDDFSAFDRPFDAMMLYVWQDWGNDRRWDSKTILPIMCRYAEYRARFPEVIQIVCNHVDWCRKPYATWYWRRGDPVLYRTPAYDRNELLPFPREDIWPFEFCWGTPCFSRTEESQPAGFIGTPSGPPGYRERVAAQVARVGIGQCIIRPVEKEAYNAAMSSCSIIVCPRGWGETSSRHWDAWLSGKVVLTDRDCDMVEMVPGLKLREKEHYLVFDSPDDIPDIVSDWTRAGRRDELEAIARRGRAAAQSYDSLGQIARFFRSRCSRSRSLRSPTPQPIPNPYQGPTGFSNPSGTVLP